MSKALDHFNRGVIAAAGLVSKDATNAEYDRALFEMISDTAGLGLNSDDLGTVEKIVRAVATGGLA